MPDTQPSHRGAGWSLVAMAVLGLVYAGVIGFIPDQAAGLFGITPALLVAGYVIYSALIGLVALIVGLQLALHRSGQSKPRRQVAGAVTLVPIAESPVAPPGDDSAADPGEPAPAPEAPAYWPADQAIGVGWTRASDALKPPAEPVEGP